MPVTTTAHPRLGTYIRPDGTTVAKGRPVFPFGLYDVSWASSTDQLIADLQAIAEGGFNTVHASAANPDTYGAVLNTARSLGLNMITEPGTPDLAARYANFPGILGWNIGDDVDNGKQSPETIAAQDAAVRAVDPKHITYISGFSPDLPNYVNTATVIAMQSYPINWGKPSEVASTYPQISILTNSVKNCNRAAYANLQAFSWAVVQPQLSGLRPPTAPEARNMTYQAIVAGAKGILYYAYADGTWNLPQNAPDLWQGLKSLVPEVNALSPYLVNGQLTPIPTAQPNVYSGFWRLGSQALLIVVNASYRDSSNLVLTLPTNVQNQQFLFSDRPINSSQPAANQLQLTLSPLSVVVYQMQD